MPVCCDCCVLSGIGLCDELIARLGGMCLCVYIYIYICVCVCVCVRKIVCHI